MPAFEKLRKFFDGAEPMGVVVKGPGLTAEKRDGPVPHYPSQFLTRLLIAGVASIQMGNALADSSFADSAEEREAQAIFSKYLSHGRSDVEITLRVQPGKGSAVDIYASTDIRDSSLNRFSCTVVGLHADYQDPSDPGEPWLDTPAMRAGVAIHEYMHCQTLHTIYESFGSPMTDVLASGAAPAPITPLTSNFRDLLAECVSDVRSILELARHEGISAAQEYGFKMGGIRPDTGIDHRTQFAIQSALEIARQSPELLTNDRNVFRLAMEVGGQGAMQALRQAIDESPAVLDDENLSKQALDAQLKVLHELAKRSAINALDVYDSGKLRGDIVTILSDDKTLDLSLASGSPAVSKRNSQSAVGPRVMALLQSQRDQREAKANAPTPGP